jgi:hypothetical protein
MVIRHFAIGTIGLLLGLALSPCEFSVATGDRKELNAHHHAQHGNLLNDPYITFDVNFVQVEAPDPSLWENITTRDDFQYTAFTADIETQQTIGTHQTFLPKIFVQDTEQDIVYEIQGIPLEYRPFSDLEWSGDRLIFDRLSQPHYGIHYEVDVEKKKLVVAEAFPA